PAIVVAPVTVIFEKLLPLEVSVIVDPEELLEKKNWTVPPAPPLLKAVTIELVLHVCEVLAPWLTLFVINVTLPVVLTFKLVNVFELIAEAPVKLELFI